MKFIFCTTLNVFSVSVSTTLFAQKLQYVRDMIDFNSITEEELVPVGGYDNVHTQAALDIIAKMCESDTHVPRFEPLEQSAHILELLDFLDCGRGQDLTKDPYLNGSFRYLDEPEDGDKELLYFRFRRELAMYLDVKLLKQEISIDDVPDSVLSVCSPYFTDELSTDRDIEMCEMVNRIASVRHVKLCRVAVRSAALDVICDYGALHNVSADTLESKRPWAEYALTDCIFRYGDLKSLKILCESLVEHSIYFNNSHLTSTNYACATYFLEYVRKTAKSVPYIIDMICDELYEHTNILKVYNDVFGAKAIIPHLHRVKRIIKYEHFRILYDDEPVLFKQKIQSIMYPLRILCDKAAELCGIDWHENIFNACGSYKKRYSLRNFFFEHPLAIEKIRDDKKLYKNLIEQFNDIQNHESKIGLLRLLYRECGEFPVTLDNLLNLAKIKNIDISYDMCKRTDDIAYFKQTYKVKKRKFRVRIEVEEIIEDAPPKKK